MDEVGKILENAARMAAGKGLVRFTRFLDPAQAAAATGVAREYGAAFSSFGGYDGAERVIGCFHPHGEAPQDGDYPLVCLHSRFSDKFCSLSHRDLLGAFMALGLTRDCIGDIIIDDADIYLFSVSNTADYICQMMTSAGRVPLRWSEAYPIPAMPQPRGTQFGAVVSSLRLDAVAAAAYRLSRSEASELIRAGLVKLDHLPCDRTDAQLREGALLSVRGKGRVRLTHIDGLTKKGRIGIKLFRYE